MIDKLKSHSVGWGKSNQQVATQKERRLLITCLKFSGQASKHIADYIARKYNLRELAYTAKQKFFFLKIPVGFARRKARRDIFA